MQTLKQFLQNLSYKKDRTIARSSKSLVLAIKKSKVPQKLTYYVVDDSKIDVLTDCLCKNCEGLRGL